MLDESLVVKLKARYSKIYPVSIRGKDYIFRALTRKEFKRITRVYDSEWDSADAEDEIVSLALLYPQEDSQEFLRMPAGIVSSLCEKILEVSAFLPGDEFTKDVLEDKRQEANEFAIMMKAYIIAAMPSYTSEDLDDKTFDELAELLALAEKVIEIQQAMYGIEGAETRLVITGVEEEPSDTTLDPTALQKMEKGEVVRRGDPIAEKLHRALGG